MIQSSSTGSKHGEDTPLLMSQEHRYANPYSQFCCCQSPPSKALLLILAWTVVVSEIYYLIQVIFITFIGNYVPMGVDHLLNAVSSPLGFISAILAAIAIFYPLSGFLADVWCGQFKVIIISLTTVLFSTIIVVITVIIWSNLNDTQHRNMVFVSLKESIPLYVVAFSAAFFIILGYAAWTRSTYGSTKH